MLPVIQRAKRDYGIGRIIVVADRGLNTSDNTSILSGTNASDDKNNDGYVYGQSIRGADAEFKKWALDPDAYINNISFSRETGEIVDGTALSINEKKITEEALYDGYYSIVTSEKELSDKEIRDTYKGLSVSPRKST